MIKIIKKIESKPDANLIVNVAIYTLIIIFTLLSFRYQYLLLNYKEWGDESETIVAAKMMATGMKLYSEIFNHHGPLTFLLAVITEKFGDFGIRGHRIPIAFLQVLAILSIYWSPALKSNPQRIIAAFASATLILVFMPNIFGHMYKYQTIAGIFLVLILSQYTIPAILRSENTNSLRVTLGNFLIASLPFLAITYLPIACLLFLSSFRFKHVKSIILGIILGLSFNLLFLGIYGSFPGFLAFHLYLNAKILPIYAGLQPGVMLVINAIKTATSDLPHLLSLIVMLISALILSQKEEKLPWRTLLLVVGLCSLLMRGTGFHALPFFYAILPLLALNFIAIDINSQSSKCILLCFQLVCILKVSLLIPGELREIRRGYVPTETEFSRLVSGFTNPQDKIIAYSFNNFEYLVSERLPASGHFFYLPWQEKYNEDPKFGISIDACKQIKKVAPKVMLIDKWVVWGRFPWDSYAGCIQMLLDSNYHKIPNKPYYIRKDVITNFEMDSETTTPRMIPSMPVTKSEPIKISFDRNVVGPDNEASLIALDIMFGTHKRVNHGNAQLSLKKTSGEEVNIDFSLHDLKDNRYKRFKVPTDSYVAGEIKCGNGGGISTWEAHDKNNKVQTCIRYIFANGRIRTTPGCPIF